MQKTKKKNSKQEICIYTTTTTTLKKKKDAKYFKTLCLIYSGKLIIYYISDLQGLYRYFKKQKQTSNQIVYKYF